MKDTKSLLSEYENAKSTLSTYIKEADEKKIALLQKYNKVESYLKNHSDERDHEKRNKTARIIFTLFLILGLLGSSSALWMVSYQDYYLDSVVIPAVVAVSCGLLLVAFVAFFFCGFRFNKSYVDEVNGKPKYTVYQKFLTKRLMSYQIKINNLNVEIASYNSQIKKIDEKINNLK